MTPYKSEDLEKILDTLPQEVQDAMFDPSVGEKLRAIGTAHGLLIDQLDKLMTDAQLAMLGIVPPESFVEKIQSDLGISKDVAGAIANEIGEKIVKDILDLMRAYQRGDKKEYSEEEIQAMINQADAAADVQALTQSGIEVIPKADAPEEAPTGTDREALLAQVENPSPISNATHPAVVAEEIQRGITGEKLSGSFKIPAETKDYSINKSSDATIEAPIKRHRDRVDPYHEPIE